MNYVDPSGNFAIALPVVTEGAKLLVLAAAAIAATTLVDSGTLEYSIPKVLPTTRDTTKDKTITETPRPKQPTYIYRWGNYTNTNFTPRPRDTKGLSFFLFPSPNQHNYVTTIEQINSTGYLTAIKDGPEHVSVRPRFGGQLRMDEWIASRPNAQTSPHLFTIILKGICVKYN